MRRGAGLVTRPLVLHLVWGPLGPLALRKFLASYHAHDAGAAHDLVVVFNGVGPQEGGAADRSSLLTELEGTEHRLVELERPVLDLVAYKQALGVLDHERACILNSHSRICADGWLGALDQSLRCGRRHRGSNRLVGGDALLRALPPRSGEPLSRGVV